MGGIPSTRRRRERERQAQRKPKRTNGRRSALGRGLIAAYDASGTYRAVYTVSIGESIYVIHAFQKKSKAGIATPKAQMDLIRQRLTQLRNEVKYAEKSGP